MAAEVVYRPRSRRFELPVVTRAMTRCECRNLSFEAFAELMDREGLGVEAAMEKTGCGGNCTACVPDLRKFLAARAPAA